MRFIKDLARIALKTTKFGMKSRQLIQAHISQIWSNPDTGNGTNIISGRATDHMLDRTDLGVVFVIFSIFKRKKFFQQEFIKGFEEKYFLFL